MKNSKEKKKTRKKKVYLPQDQRHLHQNAMTSQT